MQNSHSILDRRTLLTGAAAAGIATLATPLGAVIAARDLASGTIQDWSGVIGTTFTAQTEIGVLTLRLVAVEALPADPRRPTSLARATGFTAIFAKRATLFPSGDRIYRLSAAGIRTMDVYFSAAAGDLRAVFN